MASRFSERLTGLIRAGSLAGLLVLGIASVACGSEGQAAGSTGTTGTTGSGTPQPVTIRLGYFPNMTHAPAIIALAEGYFDAHLPDHATIETVQFNAGGSAIEALFAGAIDVTYIGPNPAINGYVRSNGEALRIVSGATSAGARLIVRPESGITAPDDLAGKRIATPALGNTQDVALRSYLLEHGLASREQGGNVEVIPTANPDILSLFARGQIDGAWVPEPWATRLVQEAGGEVFLDERDLWPNGDFVTTHLIASTKFLDEHPDLVRALIEGNLDALRLIEESPERAREVTNEGIRASTSVAMPPALIEAAWETLRFTYDPLAPTLHAAASAAFELGFLGSDAPDLDGIYALDQLNAALEARGLARVEVQE